MSARRAFVRFFSLLCLCGVACGVGLCLFKSAGTQGYIISTIAQTYHAQAQQPGVSPESAAYLKALARHTMLEAIAYDPQAAENWALLAQILESESDFAAARTARSLAAQLGSSPSKTPGKQAFSEDHFAAAKMMRLLPASAVEIE